MGNIDVDKETELAVLRRAYAKQLLAFLGVSNPPIEAAFTEVPRERFLGPGPWLALSGIGTYTPTPSDDPLYVYADRVFALIAEQKVNNGQPSFHVAFIPAHGGASDPTAADAAIAAALQSGGANSVTRLYRGEDVPAEQVWLKGEGWTLAYR